MGFNLSRAADAKNPFALAEPGLYVGYVESGEVKTSANGNEYINFRISLKDTAGNKKGTMFWMLFNADWCLFQAGRFLKATGFEMEGELSLQEIADLAVKQELLVATKIDPGKDGYQDKVAPDFNTWQGFYPVSELDHWDAIINQHMSEDEAPALPIDDSFINPPEGTGDVSEF